MVKCVYLSEEPYVLHLHCMFTDSAAGNTKASSTAYYPCIVSAVTCRLGPVEHDLPAESCSGTMLNSEACRKQQKHIAGGLGCSVAGQGYSKTVVRTRNAVAQEVLDVGVCLLHKGGL